MRYGTNLIERYFRPGVREALTMILQLGTDPPPCPSHLTLIARLIFPELKERPSIAKEKKYGSLKRSLEKVPKQIRGFYGPYPQFEEILWENPYDRALVWLILEEWDLNAVQSTIRNYLSNRSFSRKGQRIS